MKKIVLLLLISLLFQSCFSYTRAINFKTGEVQVNQEVKIYKNNGTERKGKVLSANKDQIAIIFSKTNQVLKIPVKDITGVKSKEFSVTKTMTAIFSPILIMLIVLAFGLEGIAP